MKPNTVIRRTLLLILLVWYLCSCIPSYGQKLLNEYKASNGITYQPGDTVRLGRGSAQNGSFLYVQIGGFAQSTSDDDNNIGRHYSGTNVIIKKIKAYKVRGSEKVFFTVGAGNIVNYNLYIEDAIATCEIADCK